MAGVDRVKLVVKVEVKTDVRQQVHEDLAAFRKENASSLPMLAGAKQNINKVLNQIDSGSPLPRIGPRPGGGPTAGGGVMDKFHAALRNTAIANAMGDPRLAQLMQKEAEEKRRRKERLAARQAADKAGLAGKGRLAGAQSAAAEDGDGQPGPQQQDNQAQQGQQPQQQQGGDPATSEGQVSLPLVPASVEARQAPLQTGASVQPSRVTTAATGAPKQHQHHQQVQRRRVSASRTNDPAGRRRGGRRYHRAVHNPNAGGGVREDSRVGKLLSEFSGQDDWVARTIVRHKMATIIQANVRGWLVRRKWASSPEGVVVELQDRLHRAATEAARREKLRMELAQKALTKKQKDAAKGVLGMLFGKKKLGGGGPGPAVAVGSRWGKLQRNVDLVAHEEEADGQRAAAESSDSDFSDLDVEDVALMKLRAKTPPWQRIENSQWEGQWAKLDQRAQRGNLDVLWDTAETVSRMEEVKSRRVARDPTAAEKDEQEGKFDASTQDLPPELIEDLLYQRYVEKYSRMGLLNRMPIRPVRLDTDI